jgi:transcriptional regulator of heat shock response
MITQRQEKLLDFLIKEYISTAGPVSSKALKKVTDLDVCGATIRNDLQVLTKQGFIEQPHTSAGRIPTKKAYKHFAGKITSEREKSFGSNQDKLFSDFIVRQIRTAHHQIEQEMRSLMEISEMLEISHTSEKDTLFRALTILGPAREIFEDNEDIISRLIKELENF